MSEHRPQATQQGASAKGRNPEVEPPPESLQGSVSCANKLLDCVMGTPCCKLFWWEKTELGHQSTCRLESVEPRALSHSVYTSHAAGSYPT